jgi:hypothetical protein
MQIDACKITKLTRAMVGEDTVTLPGALTKNGREHPSDRQHSEGIAWLAS